MKSLKKQVGKVALLAMSLIVATVTLACGKKTPAEYYKFVEMKEIDAGLKGYKAGYSDTKKLANGFKENLDLTLSISDEGKNALAGLASMSLGESFDLSWFNDIKITSDFSFKDKQLVANLAAKLNKAKINMNLGIDEEKLVGRIPELNNKYLFAKYEDLGISSSDLKEIKELFAIYAKILNILPDYAQAEKSVKAYTETYFKYATQVERTDKASMTADNISQEVTKLDVTIEGENLKNLIAEELDLIQKDATIKEFCDMLSKLSNYGIRESEDFYDSFVETIMDIKEELEEEDFEDSKIEMTLYVDSKDNICGRTISFAGDEFYNYRFAKEKDKFEYITEFGPGGTTLSLEGNGTVKGDVYSGDFVIYGLPEVDSLEFTVDKFDAAAAKNGKLDCKFTFTRPELETFNMAVSAEIKTKGNKGSADFSVVQLEKKLISLAYEVGIAPTSSVKLPSGEVDLSDQDQLDSYISEIKWDNLKSIIAQTGLPEEYCEMANDAIDSLAESY